MSQVSRVIVTFDVVGFHRWPEAAEIFPEVKYLSAEHRHVFKLRVEVLVKHMERETEFHVLKREALAAMRLRFPINNDREFLFDARSCEQIAKELGDELAKDGLPVAAVEVWEDGECGARVEP